ncbi:MAG: hypothetical protein JWP94_1782 [Mucilaginibacter sp.]|nr:hypothetical protein [Mucilaginibacter sp.]
MKIFFLTLSVLSFFFLASCAQKKNDIKIPDKYFPNTLGTRYTYRLTDSIASKVITVTVLVAGSSTLSNGQPVNIWTYKYPDHIDTNYVFSSKDSVVFYGSRQVDPSRIVITNSLHFPINVGGKWRVSFIRDSSTVINNTVFTQNGTSYQNTFLIHEYGHSYNYTINKYLWFTPNVGLVRIDYKSLGVLQTWQLIDYSIK